MKKLPILFVLLFSTSLFGEWHKYNKDNDGNNYYYEKDSIRKSDQYAYAWDMIDLIEPDNEKMSFTAYKKYNCNDLSFKLLKFSVHSLPMGKGKETEIPFEERDWEHPTSNSVNEILVTNICYF
jgi:hypothetical protein